MGGGTEDQTQELDCVDGDTKPLLRRARNNAEERGDTVGTVAVEVLHTRVAVLKPGSQPRWLPLLSATGP